MDNKKALILLIVALVVIAAGTVIFLTTGKTQQNEVYTVTFVSDNGAVITTQKVEQGGKAVMPQTPVKEGYVFIGWTYDGTTYDFSSNVTSNITLEAKWQEVKQDVKTFVVTFNSDGGTTIENQIVEENKKVEKPENPEKEGHVFKAWMLNDAEFDFNTEVTANLELKAKWEQVKENKEEEKEESKDKVETITVKKPTLSIPAEAPGSAQLSIVHTGTYKSGTKNISGWELYEKSGSKYTKVYSSTKEFTKKVTVDLGESKIYVARAYTYDKSNKKVYSAYSNEVKVEDILAKPTLSAGAGSKGMAILTIGLKGAYDTELALKQIAGYELYEKVGTKYTKLDSWEVRADVGETRTFVARVYAYNKANKKVYSAYSNEFKLTNPVEKPTLSTPAGGPGSAQFTIVYEGFYADEFGKNFMNGWELYEKNGTKYTQVYTSETKYDTNITLDVGESKTYVARVYAYNKSNKKIYSSYSNEVKLENKLVTPKLTEGGIGGAEGILSILLNIDSLQQITGIEVYSSTSKNGKYTLQKTVRKEDWNNTTATVSALKGQHLYFKVRTYAKNSAGTFYSEYSNALEVDNRLKTPKLTEGGIGGGEGVLSILLNIDSLQQITGIEVYSSTSKDGKYTLQKTVKKEDWNNTTATVSALKGQRLYFKVRTYVKNSAGTFYSEYSNALEVDNTK